MFKLSFQKKKKVKYSQKYHFIIILFNLFIYFSVSSFFSVSSDLGTLFKTELVLTHD